MHNDIMQRRSQPKVEKGSSDRQEFLVRCLGGQGGYPLLWPVLKFDAVSSCRPFSDHQVVGVHQVGADDQAVVVALLVAAAQQAIELVAGDGVLDNFIAAEKQGRRQGKTGAAAVGIPLKNPPTFSNSATARGWCG